MVVVRCAGSRLCHQLITHLEQSCRFCVCVRACAGLSVCGVETLTIRRLGPDVGSCVRGGKGGREEEEEEEEEEKEKGGGGEEEEEEERAEEKG